MPLADGAAKRRRGPPDRARARRRAPDYRAAVRLGPPLLYAATAGGVLLTARAAVGQGLEVRWMATYLAGYVGLVAAGSMLPGLAMWGDIVNRVKGARGVALGFDDGPHPVHTRAVARALAKRRARATFFVIGEKAAAHPDVIRELRDAGHEIGVHGHRVDRFLGFRLLPAVREDFRRSVETVERITGERPTLFRPPYGVTNPRILRAAEEHDLDVIGWSVRGLDGTARTSSESLATRVIHGLGPGAIACLHDAPEVGERVPAAIAALPRILQEADARALPVVPVGELLDEVAGPTAGERQDEG